ncbi:MAG: flagellin lysine-N-methylase [Lachnospiraceae bacterium]|nr:flagellin lysine-N-methylase [Lachnospiraceae bacterium]
MSENRKPVIEPEFYGDFHCIGGQCSFTCCKEWKIAVDHETKKRWRKMDVPETVLESGRVPKHACLSTSDKAQLSQFVVKKDGGEIIELLPNMRCPFLEDSELCRLVLDYGEECLSETCHVFPRETHAFSDRTERTLVSCCPEIVDRLHALHELHFTNLPYQERAFLLKGNDKLFQIRNIMMYWLKDASVSNEVNLKRCLFMLLDLLEKKTKGKTLDPAECLKEEDVAKLTEMILALPKDAVASIEEQNELFLDITENYRKEGRYQGLLNPLYAMAEQLSQEFEEADAVRMDEISALHAEVVAAYAPLLRNYLVAEAFATLLIPGCTLRDMVLQLEWMIMEYVLIVHAMVLQRLCEDAPLAYPKARELLILIARMTGYDGDEIEEYLSDSFENPVWPWGYADYLLA